MEDEITKIKLLDNSKETIINNYGVYNFFSYSDSLYPCNFVAAVVDGVYYTTSGRSGKSYHNMLLYNIASKYGTYRYFVMGYNNKIGIWKNDELNDNEFLITLGILNEIKNYCREFRKKKMIYISAGTIKEECYSDNIEDLINKISSLKEKNSTNKKI